MDKTISKKISVKASADKPLGKPAPRDKTFGFDPDIHLYDTDDGEEAGKGEETEILVVYDSSLAAS